MLSFLEVQGAISTMFHRRSQLLDAKHLVKMSLSLVVIDVESQIFRFAHLSVKEFLENRVDYAGEPAQALAAELCLINQLASKETTISSAEGRFDLYALRFWACHCQKAATQRMQGKLKALLSEFLGLHGDRTAFERWNRALVQTSLLEQHDTLAFPAQPLFVASAFGFFEVIESLTVPGLDLLEAKNSHRQTCFEIAASRSQIEVLQTLFKLLPTPPSSDEWSNSLLAAGARGNLAAMNLLISELHPAGIDDGIIISAARNKNCSARMMQFMLDHFKDYSVTEIVIEEVARSTRSFQALSLLLQRTQKFVVTEAILKAGAANTNTCSEILAVLLAHLDAREGTITEDVIVEAMSNGDEKCDYFEAVLELFSHPSYYCVNNHIIEAAASCLTTALNF